MTKKLNETGMQNELEGSAFFRSPTPQAPTVPPTPPTVTKTATQSTPAKASSPETSVIADERASTLASSLADVPDEVIETIRHTVKYPGKEVSFVRLTPAEKAELVDIVYTYKRLGRKTSENEINRIAVKVLLEDYKTNGSNSLLARVLEALAA